MNFLQAMMIKMGFDGKWVDMILKCVSTISYSVCLNESLRPVFSPSKGLRQGDPLSPFLFFICNEGLSSLIRLAQEEGCFNGVRASRGGPLISQLLFVDDCILFEEASLKVAQLRKDILLEYEINSSQCVNFDKLSIFFSLNVQERSR